MPKESSKSNRNAKTNKTSHVLSLLTNDGEPVEELTPAPEAEEAAAAAPEVKKTTSRSKKKKEPKPDIQKDEPSVASEIRNALEDALQAEEAEAASQPEAPAETSAPAPEAFPEPEPLAEAPASEEPVPEIPLRFDLSSSFDPEPQPSTPEEALPTPAPEPYLPEPEPAAAEEPSVFASEPAVPAAPRPRPVAPAPDLPKAALGEKTAEDPDDEPFCFNVMEALVESKAEKYIDLFGLCSCSRCRTDVIALALTRLPAKYVVATRSDLVPLLSVYEGRYNAAVVSQVMRACNRVAEQPRHKP